MIKITQSELDSALKNPEFMQSMMDYHDCQITMAEAIGPEFSECVKFHEERKEEFRIERDRLEAEL